MSREDGHLGIFFTEEFSETDSSLAICSFGHDIEASWLIWEAAEILGIPYEKISQCALIPTAYSIGTDFKPAGRKDIGDVLHIDTW